MKKVFIICSVRNATKEYQSNLELYVQRLEQLENCSVHLPHRDTNQNGTGFDICAENKNAIINADEVHVFYSTSSQGTHFDLGMCFALGKKIVVVENEEYGRIIGKNFPQMLDYWANL